MRNTIYYSSLTSPFGPIFIARNINGICLISLSTISEVKFQMAIRNTFLRDGIRDDERLKDVISDLSDYLNGHEISFRSSLDLNIGTEFQRKVWKKISEIPYGETRSYKWVANEIGNGSAVRAVGNAVGKNPVPPIVPCHRIIRSNGNLGGFSEGVSIKKWLLRLETDSTGHPTQLHEH